MAKRQIGLDYTPERMLGRLRKRVQRAGGKVIVLVHPFFLKSIGKDFEKYEKTVEALLNKSSWPIVLLEGDENIKNGSIQGRLRKLGAKGVFLVPTASGGPSVQLRIENGHRIIDNKMDSLVNLLEKTGAKDVFIAGMFAKEGSNYQDAQVRAYESKMFARKKKGKSRFEYLENPLTDGCAGIIYKTLINSSKFQKVMWIPNAKIDFKYEIGRKRPYTRPRKKPLLKRIKLRFWQK